MCAEALADEPVSIPTIGGVKASWEDEEDEALAELTKEKEINSKLAELPKVVKEDKPKPAPKKFNPDLHRTLSPEELLEMEKKADFENARDLFGGMDDSKTQSSRYVLSDKSFDDFKPKSERDFDDYATFLAGKITPFEVRSFPCSSGKTVRNFFRLSLGRYFDSGPVY